jgi:hypothetical protein
LFVAFCCIFLSKKPKNTHLNKILPIFFFFAMLNWERGASSETQQESKQTQAEKQRCLGPSKSSENESALLIVGAEDGLLQG